MLGKDEFTFFENGVVSFNLPIAGDVLGARATRTTHPRVIRGFERIFSALVERQITIHTPFLWSTKTDVVRRVLEADLGHLLPKTVSCAHPRNWTRDVHHCGACSQCIDRRFAILAAGAGEFEPAADYAIDLLTGDRSRDEDARMVAAYVKSCRTISSSSSHGFASAYPEVISSWSDLPGLSAREAQGKIWELHRRHAENVLGVIERATADHRQDLARGNLPARSLLSLCFSRSRIEPAPTMDIAEQISGFMDRLSSPICEFAVDKRNRRIWFKGELYLDGASFELFEALLNDHRSAKAECSEVEYSTASKLADALKVEEQSLRQLVKRTRDKITGPLAVQQGIVLPRGVIETGERGEGYRLSPEIREVSLSDLNSGPATMSQISGGNVTHHPATR
jgi:hypothetical protein